MESAGEEPKDGKREPLRFKHGRVFTCDNCAGIPCQCSVCVDGAIPKRKKDRLDAERPVSPVFVNLDHFLYFVYHNKPVTQIVPFFEECDEVKVKYFC